MPFNVVQMRDDELTIRGFVGLHAMEAADGDGDTDDLWLSLHAAGYNDALQMDQVRVWIRIVGFCLQRARNRHRQRPFPMLQKRLLLGTEFDLWPP